MVEVSFKEEGLEYKLRMNLKLEKKDVDYIVSKVREMSEVIAIIENVLRRYPRARRTAVENFLTYSEGKEWFDQLRSLQLDTRVYLWNADTFEAISIGLTIMKEGRLLRNDRQMY